MLVLQQKIPKTRRRDETAKTLQALFDEYVKYRGVWVDKVSLVVGLMDWDRMKTPTFFLCFEEDWK